MTRAGILAVLGLGVTQIIHWGSVFYAIAVLGPSIRAELGLPPEVAYGGLSLALLTGSLVSTQIGGLIDRIGGRRVMATGSLLCALGLAVLALAHGLALYALGWAILGLAMPMALYEAAFASLSQVAGSSARRAITYLTFLGGLASTVSWPLTNILLQQLGWRQTLLAYAVLTLALCIPLHLLLLIDHAPKSQADAVEKPDEISEALLATEHRSTAFALLAIALLLQNFISSGVGVHLLNILQGLGLDADAAVLVGVLLGPAQVSGRIAEMMLGGNRPALWTGLAAWGLLPVSFAILLISGASTATAAVFSIVYGVSNGLVTIARGTIPLALFGRSGYGRLLGKLSVPARVAGALGPIVFAAVDSRLGALAGIWLGGAVALAAFAALIALWQYAARNSLRAA